MVRNSRVYKKPPSSLKRWALPLVIALLLAGAAVCSAIWLHTHHNHQKTAKVAPANTVNYRPSSPSSNTLNENRKSSSNPSPTLNTSSGQSSTTTTPSTHIDAYIVSANTRNGNVHVGTLVSGTTTGQCSLTASQSGQSSITRTSSVQQDVNNYDCGAFNIPTSEFPATGTWKLTLTVSSNGMSGSDTANVTI